MKHRYLMLPLLAALHGVPALAATAEGNSASIKVVDGHAEATITGESGIANIEGDKVELKDVSVYVNGVSFGKVPRGSVIRYVIGAQGRTLYVSGKARSAPPRTQSN